VGNHPLRLWAVMLLIILVPSSLWAHTIITDAAGRTIEIPAGVEHVICSGPGALRLLVYLQAQNRILAVDDIEKRSSNFDARPYALANPQFKTYPLFGEFRGRDNPELITALDPAPQVIFKTYGTMGYNPLELQQKTGIPVVVLEYGDLGYHRESFCRALRIMGQVLGNAARAEEVIGFFESAIQDLKARTADVPDIQRKSCFIGGVAFKGPHGFQSTEPGYPPFLFVKAKNVAHDPSRVGLVPSQSNVAKEKLVEWDPEVLFLDLSTLQMGNKAGALFELQTDPAYRALSAVKNGRVYGLLPYNWYAQNFGSILADAYFIGKLLYPERFKDIQPAAKADEIYRFLVGKLVFDRMNQAFGRLIFKKIPVQ
jgi:iron complex transport system substrate-binding protein